MKRSALSYSAPIAGTNLNVIWWPMDALPPPPALRKPSRNDVFPSLEPALDQFRSGAFGASQFPPGSNGGVGTAAPDQTATGVPALPGSATVTQGRPQASSADGQLRIHLKEPPEVKSMPTKQYAQHVLACYRQLLVGLSANHHCQRPPDNVNAQVLLGYCIPPHGMLHRENAQRILGMLENRDLRDLSSTCRSAYLQLRPRRAPMLLNALTRDMREMAWNNRPPVKEIFQGFLRMALGNPARGSAWPSTYDDALLSPLPKEVKTGVTVRMLFLAGLMHYNAVIGCIKLARTLLERSDPRQLLDAMRDMLVTSEGQKLLLDAHKAHALEPCLDTLVSISASWTPADRMDLDIWRANLGLALQMVCGGSIPTWLGPAVETEEPLLRALERMSGFQPGEARPFAQALRELASGGTVYETACLEQALNVLMKVTQFALDIKFGQDWKHEAMVLQVRKLLGMIRTMQTHIGAMRPAARETLLPPLLAVVGKAGMIVLRQSTAGAEQAYSMTEKRLDPDLPQREDAPFTRLLSPSSTNTDWDNLRLVLRMLHQLDRDLAGLALQDAAPSVQATLAALAAGLGLPRGSTHLQRLMALQE